MIDPAARLIDRLHAVAFDLDGTLIDSVPDLAAATNHALTAVGAAPLPQEQIAAMVGGGIEVLVERALTCVHGGPPAPDLHARALADFRAHYAAHLYERSRGFSGVITALDRLQAEGLALCCITNKAAAFAEPLLAAAGLARFIPRVFTPQHRRERKPQPVLLERACDVLGVAPTQLLYVGDSAADVGAARAADCPIAAVDYGYHHGALTGEHAPDWLISALPEIVALPATPPSPRPILEQVRTT